MVLLETIYPKNETGLVSNKNMNEKLVKKSNRKRLGIKNAEDSKNYPRSSKVKKA